MKKIFLLLTFMIGTLTAQAESYTYLTFETDGRGEGLRGGIVADHHDFGYDADGWLAVVHALEPEQDVLLGIQ